MSQQPWGTAPQSGPVPESASVPNEPAQSPPPASGQPEQYAPPAPGQPAQYPPPSGHPGQSSPPPGYPHPGQPTPPPGYPYPGQSTPPPGYPYQHPSPYPGPPTPPRPSSTGATVLALVALLHAVMGTLVAFLPGVNFLGWLLLGIGIVLSVVALSLRGQKKGLAIASLSVSMAGALFSALLFGVLAMSPSAPTSIEPPAGEQESTLGSINDPLPLGSPIELEDWTYTITDVETDPTVVTAQMEASGNYFETTGPGQRWVVMTYSIINTGDSPAYPAEIVTAMVSPEDEDVSAHLPRYVLDDTSLLPAGDTRVLSIAFLIPEDSDPLIRVTPYVLQDPVYLRF